MEKINVNIYLDYYKAVREHKIVNLKSFYEKYSGKSSYKMISGTPLIINIEGAYVKVDDIIDLIIDRSLVPIALKWVRAIKQPLIADPPFIRFYWRKGWIK